VWQRAAVVPQSGLSFSAYVLHLIVAS